MVPETKPPDPRPDPEPDPRAATGVAAGPERRGGGLPLRAVFLSLLFAPLCCYWAQAQAVDRIFSLMVPPVVLTLLLVAANVPLRRIAPRFALTQAELIVFYGMQAVMCAMASEWVDAVHPYIYSYGIFHHADTQFYVVPYLSDWLFFKTDKGPAGGLQLRRQV